MKHSKVLLSGILFVALTACAQTTDGSWSALQDTKTGVQSRPYYEFGNVVQKISFKKTGNPENGLKKPVLTVYRQASCWAKHIIWKPLMAAPCCQPCFW